MITHAIILNKAMPILNIPKENVYQKFLICKVKLIMIFK
jgi:hypothetical protein